MQKLKKNLIKNLAYLTHKGYRRDFFVLQKLQKRLQIPLEHSWNEGIREPTLNKGGSILERIYLRTKWGI